MKKIFVMMLILLLGSSAGMNAQVLIGSQLDPDTNPHEGAVLELQSDEDNRGVLLPQVSLTSSDEWLPVAGDPVEGMTVFNTSTDSEEGLDGKGIYVWFSGSWNKMGASAKPCTEVAVVAATPTHFIAQGDHQTLGVELTAGSPPYNFLWIKSGVTLDEMQNTSSHRSSFQTQEFGTYVCEVTNACTPIPKTVTFSVYDVDPGDYTHDAAATTAGITWGLTGITCFDVRNSLVASSQYTLTVSNATVKNVIWHVGDSKKVLSNSSGNNSNTTLTFKNQAAVSALIPASVVLTAYIEMAKGGTTYKVTAIQTIRFQSAACCDGAVIVNGAYDYVSGSLAGDGAKAGGAANNGDASWSPNLSISTGVYNATVLNSFFTAANKDLCVYKANGNSSKTDWMTAVNNCANGKYADGDASAGWYMPNERELQAIYNALGGSGGQAINFANIKAPSYVASASNPMINNKYWSSTENSKSVVYNWGFGKGPRASTNKTNKHYVRCVRRML